MKLFRVLSVLSVLSAQSAQSAQSVLSALLVLLVLFILAIFNPVISQANDNVDQAMQSYKAKKYDQAAQLILQEFSNLDSFTIADKLKSALIFSKNLKLYQDIYLKSKINQQTYLSTLVNDDAENQSLYAKLYLAEVLILNNEPDNAKKLLNQFTATLKAKNEYYQIAEIYLAWIEYLNNKKSNYQSIIESIDKSSPLLHMATQFIEVVVTGNNSFDTGKIPEYEQNFLNQNRFSSARFVNYAVKLYVNQGKLKQASNILTRFDQQQPSYIEKLSDTKILRFYEVTLIDTIAEFYYELSKVLLEDVSKDKKYHDLAIFYLSELDLVRLHTDTAKKYMKAVDKLRQLPKNVNTLTEIRSTTHGYLLGQSSRARQAWQDAVNNFKNDPNQSADAVLMCIYLNANCPLIVQTAQLSAENGISQRFEALNTNVGRYFLLKNDNSKALRLLENAMDRSNTNSLLANDPVLLLNYAEALRLNKNYAESLQIYFSLGENFPIMRQVQDAVQGEYLFRQRANGSINVF